MNRFSLSLLSLSLISLTGCPDSSPPATDAGPQIDAPSVDAGPGEDAGPETDAGSGTDAGPVDPDAGPSADAGPPPLPEPMNHRPEAVMCDDMRDSPPVVPRDPLPPEECASHEECTEGENGRCLQGRAGYFCSYDLCFSDDDCTGPCICGTGTGANRCASGGCQIDSDCGPLSWCSPTLGSCGNFGGIVAFECHTPEDECNDDADCNDGVGLNAYCAFSNEVAHWVCSSSQCAG